MTTQRFDPAADTLAWWRNTIELHPPQSPEVGKAMDTVRCWFRSLGEMMIDTLPPGPDTTVALRELKSAASLAIGAIATNQWYWEDDGVIEVDRPVTDDEARQIKTRFVATDDHPRWPDGSPILIGQPVEVVDPWPGGEGWSGHVLRVGEPDGDACSVLVSPLPPPDADDTWTGDKVWCDPTTLIRRGAGKASGA